MNQILGIFLIGLLVLVGAIIVNMVAGAARLNGWYDFINNVNKIGFEKAVQNVGIISWIYMIVVYPFLLGLISYYSYLWIFK